MFIMEVLAFDLIFYLIFYNQPHIHCINFKVKVYVSWNLSTDKYSAVYNGLVFLEMVIF